MILWSAKSGWHCRLTAPATTGNFALLNHPGSMSARSTLNLFRFTLGLDQHVCPPEVFPEGALTKTQNVIPCKLLAPGIS